MKLRYFLCLAVLVGLTFSEANAQVVHYLNWGNRIYSVDLDQSPPVHTLTSELAGTGLQANGIAELPDGRIVYSTNELWMAVMNADGTDKTRIQLFNPYNLCCYWSGVIASDTHIFFSKNRNVYRVPIDFGGAPVQPDVTHNGGYVMDLIDASASVELVASSVGSNTYDPYDMKWDSSTDRLYFTNRGNSGAERAIKYIPGASGAGPHTVQTLADANDGIGTPLTFAIDEAGQRIFYDNNDQNIQSLDIATLNRTTVFTKGGAGMSMNQGIAYDAATDMVYFSGMESSDGRGISRVPASGGTAEQMTTQADQGWAMLAGELFLASGGSGGGSPTTPPPPQHFSIDATGGDCPLIGSWDGPTLTCTLTTDFTGAVLFEADGLTFDGDGHTMTIDASFLNHSAMIALVDVDQGTVKNLTVDIPSSFPGWVRAGGIRSLRGDGHTFVDNTFNLSAQQVWAIWLDGDTNRPNGSGYHTVERNTIATATYLGGIISYATSYSSISDNDISSGGARGIYINGGGNGVVSEGNAFNGNTIRSGGENIHVEGSSNNTISGNTFEGSGNISLYLSTPRSFGNRIHNNEFTGTSSSNENYGAMSFGYGATNNVFYNNNIYASHTREYGFNWGQPGPNDLNEALPIGGNWYERYANCADADNDGFCDAARTFSNSWFSDVDEHPSTTPFDVVSGDGPGVPVSDSDNDGVPDDQDAFPNDPNETADSDGDGVGDNGDAFPNDPNESVDSDGDGVGDNSDNAPGTPNPGQEDADGDGVGDVDDAFPNDPNETTDSDGDGVGDNTDNAPNTPNPGQEDNDGDGAGDVIDDDDDNDGVPDVDDAFPFDPSEDTDSDGDGVGDNGDAFPGDASESSDQDGDGIGDNADPDDDGNNLPDLKESVIPMLTALDGVCVEESSRRGRTDKSSKKSGKSGKSDKSGKSSKKSDKSDKSSKKGSNRTDLEEAIFRVERSLTPKLWTNATHPDSKHGHKIFDEEKKAVNALKGLIKDTMNCDDQAQLAIDALVEVDFMLTDTAISEVSCSSRKCSRDLAKAEKARAEAVVLVRKGKESKAIDQLKYAWKKVKRHASTSNSIQVEQLFDASAITDLQTEELPDRFELRGNYPNPFNPQTSITFSMPEAAHVRLTVYDLLGRRVALLVDGNLSAGKHEVRFDATNLPSGQYLYRLSTPKGEFTRTMMLIK